MNILFVCTDNRARSPMAAELFRQRVGSDRRHVARTAAVAAHGEQPLTRRELAWADIVVAMEERHRDAIHTLWPDEAYKVVVFGVADRYAHGDPKLRAALAQRIRVLVEELDTPVRIAVNG